MPSKHITFPREKFNCNYLGWPLDLRGGLNIARLQCMYAHIAIIYTHVAVQICIRMKHQEEESETAV